MEVKTPIERYSFAFTPSIGYGDGATVSWSLTKSATDASGLPLFADVTGSFRTQPNAAP